jgi:hypothetical protein
VTAGSWPRRGRSGERKTSRRAPAEYAGLLGSSCNYHRRRRLPASPGIGGIYPAGLPPSRMVKCTLAASGKNGLCTGKAENVNGWRRRQPFTLPRWQLGAQPRNDEVSAAPSGGTLGARWLGFHLVATPLSVVANRESSATIGFALEMHNCVRRGIAGSRLRDRPALPGHLPALRL